MSIKAQVILDEEEALRFRTQARKESKSLSAWLRDAGRIVLEMHRDQGTLHTADAVKKFFQECNKREAGTEPDWEEQKKLILEGYRTKDAS